MKIYPMYDRILVRRADEETKSSGGIVLPDSVKEKPMQGEVISVGSGKLLNNGSIKPLDINKGDRVLFGKYSGTEVRFEDEDLLIMREEDIMAKIK